MAPNGVVLDESAAHPTLAFVIDAETRTTVALDRTTGDVVGLHLAPPLPEAGAEARRLALVWDAVAHYQAGRAHRTRLDRELERLHADAAAGIIWGGYDHIHSCRGCGDIAGCYAPCGRGLAFTCGGCDPTPEPDITY